MNESFIKIDLSLILFVVCVVIGAVGTMLHLIITV